MEKNFKIENATRPKFIKKKTFQIENFCSSFYLKKNSVNLNPQIKTNSFNLLNRL